MFSLRLPAKVREGQTQISAREFNNLVDAVRMLMGMAAANGTMISTRSGPVWSSPRRWPRRPGGGGPTWIVPGVVRNAGGEPGDASTKCSLTYDVWAYEHGADSDDPQLLLEGAEPTTLRTARGKYVAAPNDSHALLLVKLNDEGEEEYSLWCVPGEVPDISPCEPCDSGG